jgi:hypothetical protein
MKVKSDAGGEEQRSEEEAWGGGSGTVFSYRLPIRAWEIAVG